MRIGIIGGGITGIVAGYHLSKKGDEVVIFESQKDLGGLLGSYHIKNRDAEYNIECFYHHIFRNDRELIELIEELGLSERLLWLKGSTGYYVGGKTLPLTTPKEILKFPHLTLFDKTRLAALVLLSKFGSFEKLDQVRARDVIERIGGRQVYKNFFEPLLRSKFEDEKKNISAAWLFGRIRIRSDRSAGGERLGYMEGGFQHLIARLKEEIIRRGGKIQTDEPVTKILAENGRISGLKSRKKSYRFDKVISTVSPRMLDAIIDLDVGDLPYQGACCVLFGLKRPLIDGMYWLNIADDDLPFGALIEHTNFAPRSWYGGESLLYAASYFQREDDPRWKLSEDAVVGRFIDGISKLFPDFTADDINWWRITRTPDAGPIYRVGFKSLIKPYKTAIDGLYIAGMFSGPNYPERSIEGSVKAAKACVALFEQGSEK